MIRFIQIKSAEEISTLSEYCVLNICAREEASENPVIDSVSVLKVCDREVLREAFLPLRYESDIRSESSYTMEEVTTGLGKLFPGNILAAEPATVMFLRKILNEKNIEGEVRFLPVCRLASALFPSLSSVSSAEPEQIAEAISLPRPDVREELQTVYLEANLLENCRQKIIEGGTEQYSCRLFVKPHLNSKRQNGRHASGRKALDSVSDETLKRWATSAWSASPWVFAALAIAAFILALILFPRSTSKTVDRNKPPVSYIVLSWDKAGKYGKLPTKGITEDQPVEFRIPYGVYRVQNNNSIPVELYILSEENAGASKSIQESSTATSLNAGQESEDDDQGSDGRVILRPNSDRQITIDEGQYLTLSEDATDLILFYVSAVPDEPESDTTGQVAHGQSVIYAYVKGTEVRFRRAPSLEGQIIDTLNNGQQVQVLAISGEWTHVQVQDQKGYIFSQYLTTEDPNQKYMESKTAESTTSDTTVADSAPESSPSEPNDITDSAASPEPSMLTTAEPSEPGDSISSDQP